ncbi:phage tail tape measure protein [Lysinibacillus sp.]|uniref:phage tail protein n=1 Tax=Lysinibacillus sp. TaxID=1869345 RepID=UPI0028962D9E|nr:phage tail tape measure protein [Lysinibacillus sp.]
MAYNLQTIFTVRDNASSAIRKMVRQVQSLDRAITQLNNKANQLGAKLNQNNAVINNVSRTVVHNTTIINNNSSTVNSNTNIINRNTNARNTLIGAVGRESGALKGLGSALAAVGGAYMVANTGAKAFQATVGAAAKYQHSALALQGMMGDLELTKEYLDLLESKAIKSPVLNSTDMLNNSKAFVGLSKSIPELEKVWDLVERVQAFSGVDTQQAAFSTKELFQGDYVSMMDAIGLDKRELQKITKMDGLGNKINALDKLLDKMGVNQEMVEKMGSSTIGQWSQLEEKAQSFFRKIGESGNIKLGKELTRLNKVFDALSTPQFIDKMDLLLGNVIEKAINVGKFIWKWREPIAWAAGAIAAAATAFAGVGIIAALANPISLIAAGIAGAAVGMKALYDNSETFRGAVDGIVGKVKELWGAFKTGGVNGLLDAILPKDISTQIQHVIGNIRGQISTLKYAFQTGGIGGVADLLFGEGTFEAVTAKFNEIKTFITDKITEMQPGFERLKGVFSSVWGTISSVFSTVWNSVLKPGLASLWDAFQILGNVAVVVFNNVIAPGLKFAAALFSTLWSVAGPVLSLLGSAVRVTFAVLKVVWDTILLPLTKFITGALKNAFTVFTDAVNVVGGAFSWVGGVIDTIASKISSFADAIKNVKLPDWVTKGVSATVNLVGKAIGAKPDGSHYHGLREVARNGYLASLHKGETVLPRQEAALYRSIVSPGSSLASTLFDRPNTDPQRPFDIDYPSSLEQRSTHNSTVNNTTNIRESKGNNGVATFEININMNGVGAGEQVDADILAAHIVTQIEKRMAFA